MTLPTSASWYREAQEACMLQKMQTMHESKTGKWEQNDTHIMA